MTKRNLTPKRAVRRQLARDTLAKAKEEAKEAKETFEWHYDQAAYKSSSTVRYGRKQMELADSKVWKLQTAYDKEWGWSEDLAPTNQPTKGAPKQ